MLSKSEYFFSIWQREKLPGSEKKKKKKSKKDPNAPKRPQSAYFLWFNANREELKKDNPDISITDLSKKAGEVWKQMEDTDKTVSVCVKVDTHYHKQMNKHLSIQICFFYQI